MTSMEMAITIGAIVLGTMCTRLISFFVFPNDRKVPKFVAFLSKAFPIAVIGMLVVYALKDTVILAYPHGLPELISVVATTIVHLWRRSMMLSIGGGTVLYMILVQAVF